MQMHKGKLKVCMYASRSTNSYEKKFNACESEVWAIELFRHYVQMKPFILRTDCYSIKWLQTRTVGSRVLRSLRLQKFEYEVVHRPGKLNPLCDGLSRDPLPSTEPYGEREIEALCPINTRLTAKYPTVQAKEKNKSPSPKTRKSRSKRERQANRPNQLPSPKENQLRIPTIPQ